jgi:hypothetical protein
VVLESITNIGADILSAPNIKVIYLLYIEGEGGGKKAFPLRGRCQPQADG